MKAVSLLECSTARDDQRWRRSKVSPGPERPTEIVSKTSLATPSRPVALLPTTQSPISSKSLFAMFDKLVQTFHNVLDLVPINLPWFVWIHALGLAYVGLKITFVPRMKDGYPGGFGIATLAVGLSYLWTSWMPIEDNQFLHASVPVRFVLISVAAYRALALGGLTSVQKKELLGIVIWDGAWAIATGYYLGTFRGIPMTAY